MVSEIRWPLGEYSQIQFFKSWTFVIFENRVNSKFGILAWAGEGPELVILHQNPVELKTDFITFDDTLSIGFA
jgi:hypothetical protein